METAITRLNCKRCGHKWNPRKTEVRICPKCKSPYFDRPPRKAVEKASALPQNQKTTLFKPAGEYNETKAKTDTTGRNI